MIQNEGTQEGSRKVRAAKTSANGNKMKSFFKEIGEQTNLTGHS